MQTLRNPHKAAARDELRVGVLKIMADNRRLAASLSLPLTRDRCGATRKALIYHENPSLVSFPKKSTLLSVGICFIETSRELPIGFVPKKGVARSRDGETKRTLCVLKRNPG